MGERKPKRLKNVYIDKRALVSKKAVIGEGTRVWAFAHIREGARVGKNCVIGNGVYIDKFVTIGDNVKIHNRALLYNGVIIEDNCFIGPGACFANDKYPSFNKTRNLKNIRWHVHEGSAIGANATVLPHVVIRIGAIVGAGSVVTRSVPDGATVYGNPAR